MFVKSQYSRKLLKVLQNNQYLWNIFFYKMKRISEMVIRWEKMRECMNEEDEGECCQKTKSKSRKNTTNTQTIPH